jgi:hypothetical protein
MSPPALETATPVRGRLQAYAFDRAATNIGEPVFSGIYTQIYTCTQTLPHDSLPPKTGLFSSHSVRI